MKFAYTSDRSLVVKKLYFCYISAFFGFTFSVRIFSSFCLKCVFFCSCPSSLLYL